MIGKPSFVKTSLTPTWSYPLYCRLQQLRPLPVLIEEEELTECNSGGSDTEEGSYTFLPTGSSSKKRTKKKKPRRRSSGDEDSDQEPHRQPLAQSIHDNRQVQRLNSHPNMPGTRASAAGKRSSSEKDKEDAMEKENADLKLELARVKKRMKLDKTGTSASGSGSSKAMEREVGKMTKTKLWKICKFFKNDSKVRSRFGCFGSCFYSANVLFYTFAIGP